MGRKKKSLVSIAGRQLGDVTVVTDRRLPAFRRFLDISFETAIGTEVTRWFFIRPTLEEIAETSKRYESLKGSFAVIAANIPVMHRSITSIRTPLFEYCQELGFSDQFAETLVRLLINFLIGKNYGAASIRHKAGSIEEFLICLAESKNSLSAFEITDIDRKVWLDFLGKKESDSRTSSKAHFNNVTQIFRSHEMTNLGGWLNKLRFRKKNSTNPLPEHSSELSDSGYSDVVIFQLLALFIEAFERRIGYLKRYESLAESDLPANWIYPHCSGREWQVFRKEGKNNKRVATAILEEWLNDKSNGYQILIDHHIMYHKLGWIDDKNRFSSRLLSFKGTTKNLVIEFYKAMGLSHGYRFGNGIFMLMSFYIKKNVSNMTNMIIDQIAWCLANLLMMQTGVNKEVALSIPSKHENGASVLASVNSIFVSSDGSSNEVELYGYKERIGDTVRKRIPISISKDTPLYEMLIEYEKHVKVDFDGPFFEVNKNFIAAWSKAGGIENFQDLYPFRNEDGQELTTIDTRKFRKVFATGELLSLLKDVNDANELAEKIRAALHKKNLDETLAVYLMKSKASRSIIDTAIAAITSEKLMEGLRFRGEIDLKESANIKKKVFLCNCEDPTSPTHDVAIADECRHYDLCLGCERSIITKEHLPYICCRIIQYQEARERDPHMWHGMFEDRLNIALDALDQYVTKDKRRGKNLVDEAWLIANQGGVSLPPIIASNRM